MSTLKVDLELVRKYNVAGPRYTSYPPATHFQADVTADRIEALVRENNQTARDLSLYFHLPFCYSLCWFCGCTTVITADQSASARYLGYLEKELQLLQPLMNPARRVVQLHFGGGSPTFLQPDEIRRLGAMIRERFAFAPEIEAGVEIDPRRLVPDHVKACVEVGFNRASLGVQDHNPEVQKAIHRIQPFEMTQRSVEWIRQAGFPSLNVDLIYGLPYQTPQSFERTLEEVLTLQPDRFAIFNYAHVPWLKPAQKIVESKVLPTPEVKLQILKSTIERLTDAGFVYIGMDHFAKANDELAVAQRQGTLQRNFQGYSTRGGSDIYAFGMSSISQSDRAYWQNRKELPDYYAALDEGKLPWTRGYVMTDDDRIRRRVIMQIMCNLGVDHAAMSQELGIEFSKYFAKELDSLADMEGDGLLQRQPARLQITELGRLLIRNIAMRFDAHTAQEKERRYSRTV